MSKFSQWIKETSDKPLNFYFPTWKWHYLVWVEVGHFPVISTKPNWMSVLFVCRFDHCNFEFSKLVASWVNALRKKNQKLIIWENHNLGPIIRSDQNQNQLEHLMTSLIMKFNSYLNTESHISRIIWLAPGSIASIVTSMAVVVKCKYNSKWNILVVWSWCGLIIWCRYTRRGDGLDRPSIHYLYTDTFKCSTL